MRLGYTAFRSFIIVFCALFSLLVFGSLATRKRLVTKPMLWSCPAQMPGGSSNQGVKLTFTDYPDYSEYDASPGMCTSLQQNSQPQVPVTFEVTESYVGQMKSYRLLSIDGKPITPGFGGPSGESLDDSSHRDLANKRFQ